MRVRVLGFGLQNDGFPGFGLSLVGLRVGTWAFGSRSSWFLDTKEDFPCMGPRQCQTLHFHAKFIAQNQKA